MMSARGGEACDQLCPAPPRLGGSFIPTGMTGGVNMRSSGVGEEYQPPAPSGAAASEAATSPAVSTLTVASGSSSRPAPVAIAAPAAAAPSAVPAALGEPFGAAAAAHPSAEQAAGSPLALPLGA